MLYLLNILKVHYYNDAMSLGVFVNFWKKYLIKAETPLPFLETWHSRNCK